MQINVDKAYLTAQEWAKHKLEFMYKVEQDILNTFKKEPRSALIYLIDKEKQKARIRNNKKMKLISYEMI